MITVGIDPHKSSLTEVAATIRLQVNSDTIVRLRAWADRWPQRQWAVESAAGLGRGVAQGLAAADEPVVDMPAQLAARARLLDTGHARKTDALAAAAVAPAPSAAAPGARRGRQCRAAAALATSR